jgi:hypothetical protein
MRLPTPVGSHPSQPAKPKLGTICRRVVMSDFFPICNKWWSSTYRRMSFKLSVLPFVCGSLSCSLKNIITDKRREREYTPKELWGRPFFFSSLSLLLDVSSATSAYQEFFISLFSKQKAALDCVWDLMISNNTSVSFTVRSTSIWCAFGERKKERGETKPKSG